MGTRADFWTGLGKDAKWLGSIAWDGYPNGAPADLIGSDDAWVAFSSEKHWETEVTAFLSQGTDGSVAGEHGWPWPWPTSRNTDWAYAYNPEDGYVYCTNFGDGWTTLDQRMEWWRVVVREEDKGRDMSDASPPDARPTDWPDMSAITEFTLGDRSGVSVFGMGRDT